MLAQSASLPEFLNNVDFNSYPRHILSDSKVEPQTKEFLRVGCNRRFLEAFSCWPKTASILLFVDSPSRVRSLLSAPV